MKKYKYTDWIEVFKLDNPDFCYELGISLEDAQEFKEKVEVEFSREFDEKNLKEMNKFSPEIKQKFKNRPF